MVEVGYAFRFYPKLFRDELALIGEIRNAFAHDSKEISLEDERLRKKCLKLAEFEPIKGTVPIEGSGLLGTYMNACLVSVMVLFVLGQLR
jgi:hypothetical protein